MAIGRRKSKSTKVAVRRTTQGRHGLLCKECQAVVDNVPMDTIEVTCSRCVAQMIVPPDVMAESKRQSAKQGYAKFRTKFRTKRSAKAPDEVPKRTVKISSRKRK